MYGFEKQFSKQIRNLTVTTVLGTAAITVVGLFFYGSYHGLGSSL